MSIILQADGLCKSFGAVVAATDITAAVEEGEVVALIGTNGAGKTTFVNMITGYLRPDTGSIEYKGTNITRLQPREITRLGIRRSFQIPQVYNTLTVKENTAIAVDIARKHQSTGRSGAAAAGVTSAEEIDLLLNRFGLAEDKDRLAGVLPEGVRKLLDIAMALVGRPQVLLLDEPTSGVSSGEKFEIMDRVMNAARDEGVTIMFVEHDMEIVARYAQRALAFYEGRILIDGEVDAVLSNDEVKRYVIGGTQTMQPAQAAEVH